MLQGSASLNLFVIKKWTGVFGAVFLLHIPRNIIVSI